MELFDTHFHLDPEDDAAALCEQARAADITRLLVLGGSAVSSRRALQAAQNEPGLYAAAGVHPHDAAEFDGDLAPFLEIYADPKTIAVGEVGLDYYYEHSPRERQREVFRQFLELGGDRDLPVLIHCREALADCLEILDEALVPGQRFEIHSFTGTPAEAEEMLARGAFLSYNGMATFRRAENIRETLRVVPLERLLLETDAPWLAPVPYRGKRNVPAYLREIAMFVAEVKGVSLDTLATVTTRNACEFFQVP
jgi:TatD DNase family protein